MEKPVHFLKSKVSGLGLIHWANLLYFLISALSILIAIRPAAGSRAGLPDWLDPGLAMILAQIGGILIPAFLFLWLSQQSIRSGFKLQSLDFGTSAKCFLIGLLCFPIFSTLTNISQLILALLGSPGAGGSPGSMTAAGSPWLMFIGIVIVAPLFEEILFRGALFSIYEQRFGSLAIGLVGILFAFYHFDLQRIFGALFIGLIAGWLVFRTGSILAGMLLHIGVNLIGGLLSLLMMLAFPTGMDGAAQEAVTQMGDPIALLLTGILVWGTVGLVLLVPVFFLLKGIGRRNPAPKWPEEQRTPGSLWSYAMLVIGACVYLVTQVLALTRQ